MTSRYGNASRTCVGGIHGRLVDSPNKRPVINTGIWYICVYEYKYVYIYIYIYCIYKRYFSPSSTDASLWAWSLCYLTRCLIIASFPSFSPLSLYRLFLNAAPLLVSKQSSPCDLLCPQISRFMGPTWGPSGAERTQVGPMLAPWTLLSRLLSPWPNYFHFPSSYLTLLKCFGTPHW